MQKNPFSVLGLDEDANQAQVQEAYESLKKKYSNDRFLEGEAGSEATKNLSKIEEAYGDCQDVLASRLVLNSFGSVLGKVEKLVKEGNIDAAQTELDKIELRDADWHYYQALIYYKKNWHLESKKQLEIALALDPSNEKYKKSLSKIEEMLTQKNPFDEANKQAQQNNMGSAQDGRGGYSQPAAGGAAGQASCCNTCSMLCCMDSCCECMGGDLCSCC